MLTFRKPTDEDIQYVADHMRQADVVEVRSSHNWSPKTALIKSVTRSSHISCAVVDDEPIAIFGVACWLLLTGTASPWLLGTDELRHHRKVFITETRKGVQEMINLYPYLVNWVHCDNLASIIWLRSMGFTICDPEPYGTRGDLFCKFYMRR